MANISGKVTDANGFATTTGTINLFAVTTEGSYDSVRLENGKTSIPLNSDGTYQLNNIRLGDYILFVKPNKSSFPQLLSTYYPNSIDWDIADELIIRDNEVDINVKMEGTPQALNGTSILSGYVEIEVPAAKTSRQMPRQRLSGSGVSVRRVGNSTRGNTVFNGELVAFTETDENGEFSIENLPAGDYISKIDYPGIPMNESSDIRFTLTGENMESLEVAAVVDNGVCTMKTILYTAIKGSDESSIVVYPNPFKDRITIAGDLNQLSSVYIYDINGQLRLEVGADEFRMSNTLDLSKLPTGIYLLRVNWQNGFSSSSKIIKE
jgi:hypothetical protein